MSFAPPPSRGTPRIPVPLCPPRRTCLPQDVPANHVLDRNDPHRTRAMLPDVRFGEGNPAICEGDKVKDFYLDVATSRLWVLKRGASGPVWTRVSAAGDPSATPPGALEAAGEIAAGSETVSDMTDGEKDSLLATLARYVASKEGLD